MRKILLITMIFAGLNLLYAGEGTAAKPISEKESKSIDLSGKWVGKRYQYNADKSGFIQTFEYEFELKQQGNEITGYSTIINENGDYADIELKGYIVGNQLHFAEYKVRSQAIQPEKVWCLKNGQLTILKDGNSLYLSGKTESYMNGFMLPCTGGVTQLTKGDNSNNQLSINLGNEVIENKVNLSVTPNPFISATKINYNLPADSKVTLEVMDISGKTIALPELNKNKAAGSYALDYSQSAMNFSTGVYIVKLTVNGEVFSTQMIQVNNR